MYSTLQKVDKEFDEIGDAVGGTVGEIIKAAGNISSSTLQMIDSIVTLSNWSTIATERAAEGATEAIIKVEQASVILTVISAALKIATSIISLFKRTDYMAEFRKEMAKLNHELEITKLNARIGENEYEKNAFYNGCGPVVCRIIRRVRLSASARKLQYTVLLLTGCLL